MSVTSLGGTTDDLMKPYESKITVNNIQMVHRISAARHGGKTDKRNKKIYKMEKCKILE